MTEREELRHRYHMGIALAVRERANCLGSRVGAVIVRENRIVSTGYNGTPEGTPNCLDGGCYRCSRRQEFTSGTGYDLCICVHAEQNALLSAARFGIAVENASVYTTSRPCFGCTKEMLQANIDSVYYLHEWAPPERSRAEYDRLQTYFRGGVHRLDLDDPRREWAVGATTRPGPPDETGHSPG